MRDRIKRLTWMGTTGFWFSVLFVLPNCGFEHGMLAGPGPNLPTGAKPWDSVIFCDIEKVLGRHCATARDMAAGIRLSEAAVAITEGRSSTVGLDDSPEALARCGGEPEAVLFEGPFPQGMPVCLNCSSFPAATVDEACQRACYDLFGSTDPATGDFVLDNPPDPVVKSFCDARARASVNHTTFTCQAGACDADGVLLSTFSDRREPPEPVAWTHLINVAASGTDLVRTTPTPGSFDAGAVSSQWVRRGDGYVEFSAGQTNLAVGLGFSEIPASCGEPCPDADPSLLGITLAVLLSDDGRIYIVVRGALLFGPDVNGSFGTYTAGTRFRVRARAGGATASLSVSRVEGPCAPGTVCTQTVLYSDPGTFTYPLRVDATIHGEAARIVDTRLVYIQ